MIKLNTERILVPTDFSLTAAKAIKHAAFLTQLNKGELILLHVHKKHETSNVIFPFPELRFMVALRNTLTSRLESAAESIRKEYNIDVSTHLAHGHLTTEIVKTAEKLNAGLIVMGTEGADSVSNLFLGNNSNRVLHKSQIPVMTVRSVSLKIGYSKILLPIDLTAHSVQKVNSALQVAKMFAARIDVIGLLGENEEHDRYKMDVILNQVKTLAEGKKVIFHSQIVTTNNPASEILRLARKLKADLIITMTEERPGPIRILTGILDENIVNEAQIPVLSVPPEFHEEGFESISVAGR